jgi:acyl-CoA dehydrogenase-like protein
MPADVQQLLREIDVFIEAEIKPLRRENSELFDHRKEYTRTDVDRGGMGYTRHLPFESIYRHHRRYRLTEGSDEIQLRRIARGMFDFSSGAKSPASS